MATLMAPMSHLVAPVHQRRVDWIAQSKVEVNDKRVIQKAELVTACSAPINAEDDEARRTSNNATSNRRPGYKQRWSDKHRKIWAKGQ